MPGFPIMDEPEDIIDSDIKRIFYQRILGMSIEEILEKRDNED